MGKHSTLLKENLWVFWVLVLDLFWWVFLFVLFLSFLSYVFWNLLFSVHEMYSSTHGLALGRQLVAASINLGLDSCPPSEQGLSWVCISSFRTWGNLGSWMGRRGWMLALCSWPQSLWLQIWQKNTQSIWPCFHLASCSGVPLIFKWTGCHWLNVSGAWALGCLPANGVDLCWFIDTYFPDAVIFGVYCRI